MRITRRYDPEPDEGRMMAALSLFLGCEKAGVTREAETLTDRPPPETATALRATESESREGAAA